MSITPNFCEYLLSRKDEMLKICSHTLCPDEIFVQTELWHSPFKECIYKSPCPSTQSNVRDIDWNRGKPYTWQNEDFEYLTKSPNLFARKFSSKHFDIIENIASHIKKG